MFCRSLLPRSIHHVALKRINYFSTSRLIMAAQDESTKKKEESQRMKEFHQKLKLQPPPRVPPGERFVELMLEDIDPKTGELIPNSEKDPTKWGDWQIGGRVSDF